MTIQARDIAGKEIDKRAKELSEKTGISYKEAATRVYSDSCKLVDVAIGRDCSSIQKPDNRPSAYVDSEKALREKAEIVAAELKIPFKEAFLFVLVKPENAALAKTYILKGKK